MAQPRTQWPEAPTTRPEEDDDELPINWMRVVISTFIVFQFLGIIFWLLPDSSLKSLVINRPMQNYMFFSGTWQNWSMFAPNPANLDVYLTAEVTYRDGHRAQMLFPRMYKQGYLQKYQDERFRKMIENGHLDANRGVWPFIARFAAISMNKHPIADPVVHVELTRHWQPIVPPGDSTPPYTQYMFYSTNYAPGSLPG